MRRNVFAASTSGCAGGRSHGLPIFLVHDDYLAPTAALGCASDLSEIRSRLGTISR